MTHLRFSVMILGCWLLFASQLTACQISSPDETVTRAELGANFQKLRDTAYPPATSVINVKAEPYGAKGDGVSDDTDAIQRALSDMMGLHRVLYFPSGTYLVSKTLSWSKQNSAGREAWGKNYLIGQNPLTTTIRLRDETFTDCNNPQTIMWCGGFGSADWFHNYVENLTFDVGQKNPGAVALQFYSNNSGAVRNCRFVAAAGSGEIGLDLGHRDMNGPLLVRNCEVMGFAKGIRTSHAVNGQTFEHVSLQGQTEVGIENEGQNISIRSLRSKNSVPCIRTYGTLCLVEAQLTGMGEASKWPAVINYNGGSAFVRDVSTSGYSKAIGDVETPDWFAAVRQEIADVPDGEGRQPETSHNGHRGPMVAEYSTRPVTTLFPSPSASPRLRISEPPQTLYEDPTAWANVDTFGADPTGEQDSSAAIQRAIDSGARTIFFPGTYNLKSTVIVRGKVERLAGVGGMIDYFGNARPDFRIEDGNLTPLTLEHFAYIHGGIEINTSRTIVFRSVADCDLTLTERSRNAEMYMEDFVTHHLKLQGQKVWARQLNVENEGTHLHNDGGDLWVLGYKTERGGTLLETSGGGRSEILGGFSYTTTAGKLAPMFVSDNAETFCFFNEVCFNGDPFVILVRESRGTETRSLSSEADKRTLPFSGRSSSSR